jgi:2-haloacid dehalogenase
MAHAGSGSKDQYLINRKGFITTALTGLLATKLAIPAAHLADTAPAKFKAIAFDAFPIFNPTPILSLAKTMFEEKGRDLVNLWRTTQFEYSWLRSVGGKYKDFFGITEDALLFAARKVGVTLTDADRKSLLDQYMRLDVWPDVIPALQSLRESGIRLVFLSNFTPEMLYSCMNHAKVENYFERIISTDMAKTFKPDARAYQLGTDVLKLKKEEILFVAFAGWDASGAKWFGYPTFWLNRLQSPAEELNASPDGEGGGMADLIRFVYP